MLANNAHMVYIIFAPVGAVIMATLNVLTIYVFAKKFRLQSFSFLLIVNICICDIFVCIFSNFFYLINLLHEKFDWTTGNVSCKIFKTFTMATNVAQIFSLCFINADRLRRLLKINTHQWKRVHGFRALLAIWAFSLCLTTPRLLVFEQKVIQEKSSFWNETVIINIKCKPINVRHTGFMVSIITLFLFAYIIPTFYVLYTTLRAQLFMWHRRRQVHLANLKSSMLKMNHALSWTFNLTAALFLAVWSPFFILSIVDLNDNMVARKDLIPMNFSLRCTLLIFGSAKPVIYFLCLRRFREAVKCASMSAGRQNGSGNSSSEDKLNTDEVHSTKASKILHISEQNVYATEELDSVQSKFCDSTQC